MVTMNCATRSSATYASSTTRPRRSPPCWHERSSKPGQDVSARFGGAVDARLQAGESGEELWVAIATQAPDGRFVEERLRDVLFRLVFDAAEAEAWEPRADWPGGELAWFEVARLGLREASG